MSVIVPVDDDEAMARRLQQEELTRAGAPFQTEADGSISAPLLQQFRGRSERQVVQRNVLADVNSARQESPKLVAFYASWGIIELIASVVILVFNINKPCDSPLKLWLGVFASRLVLVIPMACKRYMVARRYQRAQAAREQAQRRREERRRNAGNAASGGGGSGGGNNNGNDADDALDAPLPPDGQISTTELQIRKWTNIVALIWIVLGQMWLYGGQTCSKSAPSLYMFCLALIIIFYISILGGVLLLLAICLCLPCVMLFLRLFSPNPGASEHDISNLEERTFETPSPPEPKRDLESGQLENVAAGEPDVPSCAVCMEDYKSGDRLRGLPCKHEFHSECVDKWLKTKATCPLCRENITTPRAPEPTDE